MMISRKKKDWGQLNVIPLSTLFIWSKGLWLRPLNDRERPSCGFYFSKDFRNGKMTCERNWKLNKWTTENVGLFSIIFHISISGLYFCELFLSSPSFHEYNANGVIAFNNGILIWIPTEDLSWPSSVVQGSQQHHIKVEEVYRFGLDILEQSKKKNSLQVNFRQITFSFQSIKSKYSALTLFPRRWNSTLMRCKTVEKVVAFLRKLPKPKRFHVKIKLECYPYTPA